MSKELVMSKYSVKRNIERKKGAFGGLAPLAAANVNGLHKASNVDTSELPVLKGHHGFSDCSVSTSGAVMQYMLLSVNDKMYLIAYDGAYLQLYLINPDGGYKFVFRFATDTMTEAEAREKVKCAVGCGFDYGDNRGRRVIIYPLGYSATVNEETGELEDFLNLDNYCDFNLFLSATLHQKRIFGTDGQKIYASKVESVVEFLPSSSKIAEDDPWAGTVHHDGMSVLPILGVISYGGYVYYFCRHSFGRVWGAGNPFRTEQLHMVGTVDFASVRVLDGKLYFLSEKGLMAYDGQKLVCLSDALGIEHFTSGIAAVFGDQYYLVPDRETDTEVIYTYSPKSDSWGSLPFSKGRVCDMASTADSLYVLSRLENGLYAVSKTEADYPGYSLETVPMEVGSMASDRPMGVRLRADFSPASYLTAHLLVHCNGSTERYLLFENASGDGIRILSKRLGNLSGVAFSLALTVKGDVSLMDYEILFVKGDGPDEL